MGAKHTTSKGLVIHVFVLDGKSEGVIPDPVKAALEANNRDVHEVPVTVVRAVLPDGRTKDYKSERVTDFIEHSMKRLGATSWSIVHTTRRISKFKPLRPPKEPNNITFVALSAEGRLVGAVEVEDAREAVPHVAHVNVHPDFRGKGACAPLLRSALVWLRDILGVRSAVIENASRTSGGIPACMCYTRAGRDAGFDVTYHDDEEFDVYPEGPGRPMDSAMCKAEAHMPKMYRYRRAPTRK